jgi:hypothetical protein
MWGNENEEYMKNPKVLSINFGTTNDQQIYE